MKLPNTKKLYNYFTGHIEKKNVTFTCHVLMTRLQAQNESISQYVHALSSLAKECSFQAVSAEKYKDNMTRYAFINEL